MADARARLEELRARARYEELKAKKAGGSEDGLLSKAIGYGKEVVDSAKPYAERAAAGLLGIGKGVTLGYLPLSDDGERIVKENPIASGFGEIVGGIVPGAAIEKGLAGLLKMGPGVVRGATAGAIGGAAYNPGEEGSHAVGAGYGAGVGGTIGMLGNLGRSFNAFRTMGKPGTADNIMQQIDDALRSAEKKGFVEPARKARELMKQGDVQVNLDRLRGITPELDSLISRRASPQMVPTTIRGMFGEPVEKSAEGMQIMGGREADVLRRYLDKVADFRKSRLFQQSQALDEPAEKAAGMLRRKTRAINPEIEQLQKQASKAKGKIDIVRKQVEGQPIEALSSQEFGTRGSILADIDQMGGSKLVQLADKLRGAKAMTPSLSTAEGLMRPLDMSIRAGKVGLGAVSEPFTRVAPPGSIQGILNMILEENWKKRDR